MYRSGRLTSDLSEPSHISPRHDLSVLEPGAQGGDVRVLECVLESIQDYRVRPISDGVDILNQKNKIKLT